VAELTVIFRTQSDVEASVVRGLLEAHGVPTVVSSDLPHSIFPVAINGLGEVRISVHPQDADEARRIIDSHRTELPNGRVVRLRDEFEALERAAAYRFRDRGLVEHAMTHTSRANEDASGGVIDNESLEFLGDAVLGFVIGELIFKGFPALQEGSLSKIKAHLVSATTLSQKARELGIGVFLRLGSGEARSGGANKDSLLADALEAVIASIYLDGSLPAVVPFISRMFEPDISGIDLGDLSFHDYKTTLQETAQRLGLPLPEYRVLEEIGPDHEKTFLIEVLWNGIAFAQGRGPSKKEAQRQAARATLEKLARA